MCGWWGWWDEHDWNRSVSSLPFHALVECVEHLMFCLLEHVECGRENFRSSSHK
jgi:hypothetical protein